MSSQTCWKRDPSGKLCDAPAVFEFYPSKRSMPFASAPRCFQCAKWEQEHPTCWSQRLVSLEKPNG